MRTASADRLTASTLPSVEMSPQSPGPQQREGEEEEEGGERGPKRRRVLDHKIGDSEQKTGKMGRKRNATGPPRRAPGKEVPLLPRPSVVPDVKSPSTAGDNNSYQGMVFSPEPLLSVTQPRPANISVLAANESKGCPETFSSEPAATAVRPLLDRLAFTANENDNYDGIFSQELAVATTTPLSVQLPMPMSETATKFAGVAPASVIFSPQVAPQASRPRTHGRRGLQPITIDKLHPEERALRLKFISKYCELEVENAIVSLRWCISIIHPKLAKCLGHILQDLPEEEIKRFSTPRGWLRPTRVVYLPLLFSEFEHRWECVRVYAFNDDDPDMEVPLIIGHPWIEQDAQLTEYVNRNNTVNQSATISSIAGATSNVEY